jgi:prepilin-type N-terminal cleavage/methylation domain-containing protein
MRWRSWSSKDRSGFTLIEVMVACLLLLVVMAGFIPFFLSGLEKTSLVRYKSIANNIARERMELIRQMDYREITSDTSNPRNLDALLGISATVRDIPFTVSHLVEDSSSAGSMLKRVTVTVTWTAPPYPSPAIVSSLIHQQFLGPRGSQLAVSPSGPDLLPGNIRTPFAQIGTNIGAGGNTLITYHIAQADWDLCFKRLDQVGMAKRPVYLRLQLVDDEGAILPLGNAADDYRIDNSHLYARDTNGDGLTDDVVFEYSQLFDPANFPDGYYELRAIAYNEYNQPGNVWRLRVRIEQNVPGAPSLVAVGLADNQTIELFWTPGAERDRKYWVLERQKWVDDPDDPDTAPAWGAWTTVATLGPSATSYRDAGRATEVDPWGDPEADTPNSYQYQLWAVDLNEQGGWPGTALEQLPSPTPGDPSVTTTTLGPTTTTTLGIHNVLVRNGSNKDYSIVVRDGASTEVWRGTAARGTTTYITGLGSGSFGISGTASGRPEVSSDFTLPAQANQVVLEIL